LPSRHVVRARAIPTRGFELDVAAPGGDAGAAVEQRVQARGVVLATGRFLGGGLAADRKRIRETLFDLPVWQPADRRDWHRPNLLDPRGHPIHAAGLETDEALRPLDATGRPAFDTLFAAGSILAHQDWTRSKSGAGIAVATARAAVNAFRRHAPS
jgi:glycerol-3-phosphate dehydrogenase subunit B